MNEDNLETPLLQFDIVAFHVPNHKSLVYRAWVNQQGLHRVLDEAISKGANVFSIRRVVD